MINTNSLLSSFLDKTLSQTPKIVENKLHIGNFIFKNESQFKELKVNVDNFLNDESENRFFYISGIRGVGKTTMIYQIYEYLQGEGISSRDMLYFSAEKLNRLSNDTIFDVVNLFIEDCPHESSKKLFVFVDEAQMISDGFNQANTINILFDNVFLIFLGSYDFEYRENTVENLVKQRLNPLNFNEYLSIYYGENFSDFISYELQNTVMNGEIVNVCEIERSFYKNFPENRNFIKNTWKRYMACGGFLSSIGLDENEAGKRIYANIEEIIEKDVFHFYSYDEVIKSKIFRVLYYISFRSPDSFSKLSLSKFVYLSNVQLHKILTALEKTSLIFPLTKYGSSNRRVNYYFTSPNYNVALNREIGEHVYQNANYSTFLAESLVASTLFKMQKQFGRPIKLFLPIKKNQASFLIEKEDGNIIPVVVEYEKKPKKYILTAIDKYGSEYGIVVSDNVSFVKKDSKIIHIPLTTFSLI